LKRQADFTSVPGEIQRPDQRRDINPFSPPSASDACAAMASALIVGLVLAAIVVCGLVSLGALR